MPRLGLVQPEHIALFATPLFSKKLAHTTIRSYLSAILFVMKLNGVRDPTSSFLVSTLLRGVKITLQKKQLFSISKRIWNSLLDSCFFVSLTASNLLLYRAMLLTAYYGLQRASEFLQTNTKHILRYRDAKVANKRAKKHILLRFVTYKTAKTCAHWKFSKLMENGARFVC